MTMISARLRHLGTSMPLALVEAGLVVSWSSGFVGTRLAVDHAPVFLVVFWRCILVSLILLPWAIRPIRRSDPLRRSGWRRLGAETAIGALAMGSYLAGVAKGIELGVPAGLAALIADLLPIGTALLGAAFFGRYLPGRGWAGLVAGGIGVAIVGQDALASGQIPVLAILLPLGGMAALAIATLWQARLPAWGGPGPLARLWLHAVVSALVFAGLAGADGGLAPPATPGFAVAVLWTGLLSSLGGYGLYWLCLARSSPTRVATVLYLSPTVTLAWAWAMFGEPLTWMMVVGTALSAWGISQVIRAEGQGSEQGQGSERRRPARIAPDGPSCRS